MLKKIFTFSLFIIIFYHSYAKSMEDFGERLLNEQESEHTNEQNSFLLKIKRNKLNINDANYQELLKLPWLSPITVNRILDFRKKSSIKNISTLEKIGLSEKTIKNIAPFLKFHNKSYPINCDYRIRSQYSSTTEFNNPFKFYQSLCLDWKNFNLNFLNEKDSGERNYFDFYSASFSLNNLSFIDRLVVGNYRLSFGQGIIFSPKLGLCKGYNTTKQPIKSSSYVKPYTSASENFSLYGVATQLSYKNIRFTPYYSKYKLDASLKNNYITSIYDLGYHRTTTEQKKKDKTSELLCGFNLSFGGKNNIGLNITHLEFEHKFLQPELSQKYNLFSLEYNLFYNNFFFFGETAFSQNKLAHISGLYFEIDSFNNLIIYRNYHNDFPTFHGNPFHAGGKFDNEDGLYYGIDFNIFSDFDCSVYFDIYNFPHGSNYTSIPSYGIEKLISLSWDNNKTWLRFSYKNSNKDSWKNINDVSKLYKINKSRFRLDLKYRLNDYIKFKFRFDYSYQNYCDLNKFEDGFLMFQQVQFSFNEKLNNYFMVTQYRSDEILLYMYENDLDGIMKTSQFKGDGLFFYYLFKFELWTNYSFQFKYSQNFWKRNIGYNTGFDNQLGKTYILKAQLEVNFDLNSL